jgi:CTP-dependent riboflavin kinase
MKCFTLAEAKEKLHRSRQVTARAFQELERSGLIIRKKQGLGCPVVIRLNVLPAGKERDGIA